MSGNERSSRQLTMHTPEIEIHETAFLTCWCRASDETLSGDPFAKYCVTPKAEQWVRTYINEVSREEPFVHCLRNRFFLDHISSFLADNPKGTLVNIGAGFSLYPYLLPSTHRFCDVDVEPIVNLKSQNLEEWVAAGKFPFRDVTYFAAELDDGEGRKELEQQLLAWIAGSPTFILIEGVLFYLQPESVLPIFEMFAHLQKTGDQVGSVSFLPEILKTEVHRRLLNYLGRYFRQSGNEYIELEAAFYENLENYRLLIDTEYCELSRRYAPQQELTDPEAILNEHMYILERL